MAQQRRMSQRIHAAARNRSVTDSARCLSTPELRSIGCSSTAQSICQLTATEGLESAAPVIFMSSSGPFLALLHVGRCLTVDAMRLHVDTLHTLLL